VLVVSGLAKVGDVVALEDVRSSSIANKTLEQIIQTPVIYTTVNGKRTIDTQATPAALGCALPTPVTHSINREFKLEEYVGDLCSRAKELLVSNLTDAQSIAEVEQRICVDDHARNLKPVLAAMIMADAGTTGLPNFSKLVETYADPEVLKAIQAREREQSVHHLFLILSAGGAVFLQGHCDRNEQHAAGRRCVVDAAKERGPRRLLQVSAEQERALDAADCENHLWQGGDQRKRGHCD
jgi:hypothetical protein